MTPCSRTTPASTAPKNSFSFHSMYCKDHTGKDDGRPGTKTGGSLWTTASEARSDLPKSTSAATDRRQTRCRTVHDYSPLYGPVLRTRTRASVNVAEAPVLRAMGLMDEIRAANLDQQVLGHELNIRSSKRCETCSMTPSHNVPSSIENRSVSCDDRRQQTCSGTSV